MPNFFGFQRRKSSSNELSKQTPLERPQSSFRVLDRPSTAVNSFDGGYKGRRRTHSEIRPLSEGQFVGYHLENIYHGNTLNRSTTTFQLSDSDGHHETSGSSIRYSNSSTIPSASSISQFDDVVTKSAQIDHAEHHATKSQDFVNPTSKALSFGTGKRHENTIQSVQAFDIPQQIPHSKDGPQAIPRKHVSSDAQINTDLNTPPSKTAYGRYWSGVDVKGNNRSLLAQGDDLGHTFDKKDNGKQRQSIGAFEFEDILDESGALNTTLADTNFVTQSQTLSTPQTASPRPLRIRRNESSSPGPLTGASYASHDQFMSHSPLHDEYEENEYEHRGGFKLPRNFAGSPSRDLTGSPSTPLIHSRESPRTESHELSSTTLGDTRDVMGYFNSFGGNKGYSFIPATSSSPLRKLSPPIEAHFESKQGVTLYDGDYPDDNSIQQSRQSSFKYRATAKKDVDIEPELDMDADFKEMARSAAKIEAGEQLTKERPHISGKVMSAAKFEAYKKDQELYRNDSIATKKSEEYKDDHDEYDEDDELERKKEISKQRKKQEAKMSVYRQQMMKVTGEKSQQVPILEFTSQISPPFTKTSESASDEEDEDVPLGILAAHGFPSKQRPPSHMPQGASSPSIRASSEPYPAPVTPPVGGQKLPDFAKGLPKDPYYGASIVNPTVRESIGFTTTGPAGSIYGGSDPGTSRLPLGGLVGVIAKEEQAKARRRGSPNRSFDASAQNVGLLSYVEPTPGSTHMSPPPMLSPEAQAQMAINKQMQQMMQMQMQWMQQMMAFQGAQISGKTGISEPKQTSLPTQNIRGQTGHLMAPVPMQNGNNQHSGIPNPRNSNSVPLNQRPMSRYQNTYAPSIAPSDRSNTFQPPRYRPVSIAPLADRTSTISYSNALPKNDPSQLRPYLSMNLSAPNLIGGRPVSTTRVPVNNAAADDEDDDEAWEEIRRKKESQKKLWKSKKSQAAEGKENSLDGVFYPTEIP